MLLQETFARSGVSVFINAWRTLCYSYIKTQGTTTSWLLRCVRHDTPTHHSQSVWSALFHGLRTCKLTNKADTYNICEMKAGKSSKITSGRGWNYWSYNKLNMRWKSLAIYLYTFMWGRENIRRKLLLNLIWMISSFTRYRIALINTAILASSFIGWILLMYKIWDLFTSWYNF